MQMGQGFLVAIQLHKDAPEVGVGLLEFRLQGDGFAEMGHRLAGLAEEPQGFAHVVPRRRVVGVEPDTAADQGDGGFGLSRRQGDQPEIAERPDIVGIGYENLFVDGRRFLVSSTVMVQAGGQQGFFHIGHGAARRMLLIAVIPGCSSRIAKTSAMPAIAGGGGRWANRASKNRMSSG